MQAKTLLDTTEEDRAQLPEHLFQMPDQKWALWRWVCLRGAGFAAEGVSQLSAPAAAAAADLLLSAETCVRERREAALQIFNAELDRLRREGHWDTGKPYRLWLLDRARALKQGKPFDVDERPEATGAQLSIAEMKEASARVASAEQALSEARLNFEQAYTAGVKEVSLLMREIAGDERFREAIAWQNRNVLHGGLDSLLRHKTHNGARDSKQRQNEDVVASYWQRYCVKNDTIGFFGPVGWAKIVDEPEAFDVRPGAGMLATRKIYFEQWGIDALISTINTNLAIGNWASPRRLPFVRLEGDWLHLAFRRSLRVPAKQASVLRACDGSRTAEQIAAHLRRTGGEWNSDAEILTILKGLKAQGLIAWQFEVPVSAHPEELLRELLERVTNDDVRRAALSMLEELEARRERVAAAAGRVEELDAALQELDESFTRLTGVGATRWAGRMYAGRTLVYEDCRRDIEVEIGADVVKELSGTLALLLDSARWFTYEAGVRFREAFKEIYEGLASKTGSRTVEAVTFRMEVQATLFSDGNHVMDEVEEQLRRRWESVLSISPDERRMQLSYEDLRRAVETTFDAPRAGWSAARHHSPDLMIAAASEDAIRRGDYQIILGELHLGTITMGGSVFFEQHPSKHELMQAKEADLPETRAVPVIPNSWLATHTFNSLNSMKDYYVEFTPESFISERERAVPIVDFVIEEEAGELVARTRDGRLRFDVLEMFGQTFSEFATERFKAFGSQLDHTPRVSIDRVTVARETWRCGAGTLAFANVKDEAERFIAARRWAQSLGMPRRVFVKVPIETKPCYIDFDSPIYVGLLAKLMRRTVQESGEKTRAVFTEMLPDIEQSWLPDAEGRRYTCELRVVALDQAR